MYSTFCLCFYVYWLFLCFFWGVWVGDCWWYKIDKNTKKEIATQKLFVSGTAVLNGECTYAGDVLFFRPWESVAERKHLNVPKFKPHHTVVNRSWNMNHPLCTYRTVLRIRIRDWVLFWPLDPGWEKVSIRIRDPGWTTRIRDEQPGSYFLELRNHFFAFFGVKILKFFDEDTGSGMETVRIRDGKKSDQGLTSRIRHNDVAEAKTTRHFIPRSQKEMLGIILILGFDKF